MNQKNFKFISDSVNAPHVSKIRSDKHTKNIDPTWELFLSQLLLHEIRLDPLQKKSCIGP